jgi:hypothetical protein
LLRLAWSSINLHTPPAAFTFNTRIFLAKSVRPSVYLHVKALEFLDGFLQNLIIGSFNKTVRRIPTSVATIAHKQAALHLATGPDALRVRPTCMRRTTADTAAVRLGEAL